MLARGVAGLGHTPGIQGTQGCACAGFCIVKLGAGLLARGSKTMSLGLCARCAGLWMSLADPEIQGVSGCGAAC